MDIRVDEYIIVDSMSLDAEKPYNLIDVYKYEGSGTYSISEDVDMFGNRKIEFVYADGSIKVQSFSNTENTMTINSYQLLRKQ